MVDLAHTSRGWQNHRYAMKVSAPHVVVLAGLTITMATYQPVHAGADQKNDAGSVITVIVTDMAGTPIPKSDVAAVLRTGALQKGITDVSGARPAKTSQM